MMMCRKHLLSSLTCSQLKQQFYSLMFIGLRKIMKKCRKKLLIEILLTLSLKNFRYFC